VIAQTFASEDVIKAIDSQVAAVRNTINEKVKGLEKPVVLNKSCPDGSVVSISERCPIIQKEVKVVVEDLKWYFGDFKGLFTLTVEPGPDSKQEDLQFDWSIRSFDG
jgi:hypothetical protein